MRPNAPGPAPGGAEQRPQVELMSPVNVSAVQGFAHHVIVVGQARVVKAEAELGPKGRALLVPRECLDPHAIRALRPQHEAQVVSPKADGSGAQPGKRVDNRLRKLPRSSSPRGTNIVLGKFSCSPEIMAKSRKSGPKTSAEPKSRDCKPTSSSSYALTRSLGSAAVRRRNTRSPQRANRRENRGHP